MNPQDKPAAVTPTDSPPSAEQDSAPAEPVTDMATLLEQAASEAAEMKDAWLRARADAENLRKQGALDLARTRKYAIENFAGDLLPVRDALESTLAAKDAAPEALRDGVLLTLKQLEAAFEKAQVNEINPAGQKFDPHQHMAMTMVESTEAPNTVVQVFQKGYRLQDRVLRPALVAVARGPESNSSN
jgi:molecular chaperone GrpE